MKTTNIIAPKNLKTNYVKCLHAKTLVNMSIAIFTQTYLCHMTFDPLAMTLC